MKMDDEMMDMGESVDDGKHWSHSDRVCDLANDGYKLLTMEDVSECLQKDFGDEISDSKKYLCMARIADCAGDEYDSHYLLEMAKDECTHATFIYDFMKRHDMCIHKSHETCYKQLKDEMAQFF